MTPRGLGGKVVLNERGTQMQVIPSWKTYQEIAKALGWDLDAQARRAPARLPTFPSALTLASIPFRSAGAGVR